MQKKLIIVGAGEHGRMMYDFFSSYTDYDIAGFSVERKYKHCDYIYDKPVYDFESLPLLCSADEYCLFIAVSYIRLNKERTRLYKQAKEEGYSFASFVHPSCTVNNSARIGENVAIFESNVIQYNVEIGNNSVIQAGGVIAHGSIIYDNVWIAPSTSIAGFCKIGTGSFIGVNSTISSFVEIPSDTIIGAGAVIYKSIEKSGVYVGNPFRCISSDTDGYLMK